MVRVRTCADSSTPPPGPYVRPERPSATATRSRLVLVHLDRRGIPRGAHRGVVDGGHVNIDIRSDNRGGLPIPGLHGKRPHDAVAIRGRRPQERFSGPYQRRTGNDGNSSFCQDARRDRLDTERDRVLVGIGLVGACRDGGIGNGRSTVLDGGVKRRHGRQGRDAIGRENEELGRLIAGSAQLVVERKTDPAPRFPA